MNKRKTSHKLAKSQKFHFNIKKASKTKFLPPLPKRSRLDDRRHGCFRVRILNKNIKNTARQAESITALEISGRPATGVCMLDESGERADLHSTRQIRRLNAAAHSL